MHLYTFRFGREKNRQHTIHDINRTLLKYIYIYKYKYVVIDYTYRYSTEYFTNICMLYTFSSRKSNCKLSLRDTRCAIQCIEYQLYSIIYMLYLYTWTCNRKSSASSHSLSCIQSAWIIGYRFSESLEPHHPPIQCSAVEGGGIGYCSDGRGSPPARHR